MKTWILALALVIAAAGSASAQDEGNGEGRGRRGQGEGQGQGEGRQGRGQRGGQRPETPDEMLKAADKDADGKLSQDEFLKHGYERLKASPMGVTRAAAMLDTDKDGQVSLEEYAASRMGGERFKALDKDASGFLEKAELEAMAAERGGAGRRGGPGRLEEMIKRMDKNGDGKLTPDEVERPEMFERMDRNKDGVIDAADAPPQGGPGGPGGPPPAGPKPGEPEKPGDRGSF